jgi:hypothetical protein
MVLSNQSLLHKVRGAQMILEVSFYSGMVSIQGCASCSVEVGSNWLITMAVFGIVLFWGWLFTKIARHFSALCKYTGFPWLQFSVCLVQSLEFLLT